MKRAIHITINKNSGVGQSMAASSLMQYFDKNSIAVQGIDLDNTFSTLASYSSLDVELIDVSTSGDCSSVSGNKLNELLDRILMDNRSYVIDANSLSYSGITKYFSTPEVLSKLDEKGLKVYFHIVVRGGANNMTESLQSLKELIEKYPEIKIYPWLNAYTGEVVLANKKFEATNVYIKYSTNFMPSISIDKLPSYSEPDIQEMLSEHLTVKDLAHSNFDEPKQAKMKRFVDTIISRIGQAFA
jgi:hypothetical protein